MERRLFGCAPHGALPDGMKGHSLKYLNNWIEQYYCNSKFRANVTLRFKQFGSAGTTISGIALMHRTDESRSDLCAPVFKNAALLSV